MRNDPLFCAGPLEPSEKTLRRLVMRSLDSDHILSLVHVVKLKHTHWMIPIPKSKSKKNCPTQKLLQTLPPPPPPAAPPPRAASAREQENIGSYLHNLLIYSLLEIVSGQDGRRGRDPPITRQTDTNRCSEACAHVHARHTGPETLATRQATLVHIRTTLTKVNWERADRPSGDTAASPALLDGDGRAAETRCARRVRFSSV